MQGVLSLPRFIATKSINDGETALDSPTHFTDFLSSNTSQLAVSSSSAYDCHMIFTCLTVPQPASLAELWPVQGQWQIATRQSPQVGYLSGETRKWKACLNLQWIQPCSILSNMDFLWKVMRCSMFNDIQWPRLAASLLQSLWNVSSTYSSAHVPAVHFSHFSLLLIFAPDWQKEAILDHSRSGHKHIVD